MKKLLRNIAAAALAAAMALSPISGTPLLYTTVFADIEAPDDAENVVSIELTTVPKTVYWVGEELDVSGGTITVYYDSGLEMIIPITESMIKGFDTSETGTLVITVSYMNATAEYEITVRQPAAVSLAITSVPKTDYFVGEELDVTNGMITVTYSSGKTEELPMTKDMISGFSTASAGTYEVTVTYLNVSATYTIKVGSFLTISGISIKTKPRTVYRTGEALDVTGGVIIISYTNGETVEMPITEDMISGFSTERPGKYMVTVTYKYYTAGYIITVTDAAILVNDVEYDDLTTALDGLKKTTGKVEIIINKDITPDKKITLPKKASLISIKGASRNTKLTLKNTSLSFSCPAVIENIELLTVKGANIPVTSKSALSVINATTGALKAQGETTITGNTTISGTLTCTAKASTLTLDTCVIAGNVSISGKDLVTEMNNVLVNGTFTVAALINISGSNTINGIFTPKGALTLNGEIRARWAE